MDLMHRRTTVMGNDRTQTTSKVLPPSTEHMRVQLVCVSC